MNEKSVGFRFRPTDEEIITYFLEGKMSEYEFPEHPIFEIDFRKYSPSQLPQMSALPDDQVWHFFSAPSYKHLNNKRADRSTSDGYWKVTGKDRPIRNKRTKEVIGMKKTLVFYKGRSSNAERTNWVMHEFHSINANRYPKEFVFCRIKRKNDDNYDASQDEPSNFLPSTSGTPDAGDNISSQVNHQPPVELESHDCYQDYVILQPLMQTGEGPSDANRSNNQPNLLDNQLGMPDLEDDINEYEFVNSLLADDIEVHEETVHAHPFGFTPAKPLRGRVFLGESSKTVTQTVHAEIGHVLRTPCLCKGNASSKESEQMQKVHSSNRISDINLIDFSLDEFPTTTRTSKSQHLPISHNFRKESAPKGVQLQVNASRKAVPRDKGRDAEQAIDCPPKEHSIMKLGEDQKRVQTTHTKTNMKLKSSVSDGKNRENSSIFPEFSLVRNKQNPSLEFLGSVDISVILLVIIISGLASRH